MITCKEFCKMFFTTFTKQKPKLCAICLTIFLFMLVLADQFLHNYPKSKPTSASLDGIFVPIIMYHSVNKDDTLSNDYVITPVQLEKDFVYLTQNGYTPVFMQDLIDFVHIGTPLPEKPVVITFDDGFSDNFQNVLPLLEKYNFKATISIVGSFSQKASSPSFTAFSLPYLTWDEIATLYESCHVEIANHTFNMHSIASRKGCSIMDGESFEDYRNALISDLSKTQTLLWDNCKILPTTFTYPYGFVCEPSLRIVKSLGFKASLGVEEKPNYLTTDPDCLYNLNRYNRPANISTEDFFKKALHA